MMNRAKWIGCWVVVLAVAAGCAPSSRRERLAEKGEFELPDIRKADPMTGDGVALLTEVATTYGAAKSYQCTQSWEFIANGQDKATSERLFFYAAPNKYRVVAMTGSIQFVSVSDGAKTLEYAGSSGRLSLAPNHLADADAEMIRDSQLAGSLLFHFFRGPGGLPRIVDSSESVSLVPSTSPKLATLKFKAKGRFGTTQIVVDKSTKLIQSIQCQFEPMVEETQKLDAKDQLRTVLVTEKFANIKVDQPASDTTFSTAAPKGVDVKDETVAKDNADLGILTEGMKAPDFKLKSLDGKVVALSDLRGQVVLLDFWATWCLPCREALPKTLAVHKKYGGKGLAVWTLPEEDADAVSVFLNQERLQGLPVLLDPDKTARIAYKVNAIPSYYVIDGEGVIRKVFMGAPDIRMLLESLREAGLPI